MSQVGAVPRFAVLRWALGEDADLWLPLRGQVSRTSPCVWCGRNTRNFPAGPARGALCFTCIGTDLWAFSNLTEDSIRFANHHSLTSIVQAPSHTPITEKLLTSEGPLSSLSLAPCLLCQTGANGIDHWLSYCPVTYLAWYALWKGTAPLISWRHVPQKQVGVALCYLLFHLRRLVAEHGGLQPVIVCAKVRSISHHAMDLWQRTYRSLPATMLHYFRAPPLQADLPCTHTVHIRIQRFPQTQLESALLPDKGLCTS